MTRKIRDNGAEASIHFQKAETIAFYHNSREAFKPETSHAELEKMNECDKTAEEARELFEKLSAQGDENFLKNCGRRTNMKASNKLWESALNLRERHTLEDVQRLNARIQEITGFIPIQTAIHRDEGHIDEKTGDFVQNIHAQTTWLTQNPETGKSMAYLLFDKKDVYRKIQDVVAEELGMTRGKPAEITGARHFKNMRDYKQMKRSESKLNKEWEAKLEANNKAWQEKQAEWEAKQAEREARQAEWEKKLPEIMARKEQYSKFIIDKIDWEAAKTGKKLAYEMEMLGIGFAGIANPNGNIIVEAQKSAIRNIFYMLGTTAQLAVFLLKKTLQNDEKLAADAKIYNVESTLLRAVDYVANSDPSNAEELKKRIQRTFRTIPEDKREELFAYAIENAPTDELREDIKALIEGRFSDIARTEAAQKRIENRDLRAALKEYSEEIRKIRDELKQMDEENRILNLAERAILREKGANRSEYADQEAQNKARQEEIKGLKDAQKALKKTIDDQKQSPDKDAETIKRQAAQIKELNDKISELTRANTAKQRELEEARIITPKQLDVALKQIDELEEKLKQREEQKPEQKPEPEPKIEPEPVKPEQKPKDAFDIFDIIDEQKPEKIEPEPCEEPKIEQPKPEPKIEKPEPEPIKKDDNLGIFGYSTPKPEPRRRLDDYEPRKREDDRPRYTEPEKIEPEPEPFRDPWEEIQEAMEKWKKEDSESEKSLMGRGLRLRIDEYEKNGGKMSEERQNTINRYRFWLSYDPIEAEREAQKNAETMQKIAAMNREREQKRQQTVEIETAIKYDDVRGKNVKQEDETRQRTLKKRKDELEMGR